MNYCMLSITQDGWTPLISAAYYGKCDVVTELLSLGGEANTQNKVSQDSHYHLELTEFRL